MSNEIREYAPYTDELVRLARGNQTEEELRDALDNYHEKDIAGAVGMLDQKQRLRLYRALGTERLSTVFSYLDDAGKYLGELPLDKAAAIVEEMDSDDAVDLLETLDEQTRKNLVGRMDPDARADIRLICSYQEDEIGSRMTTNYVLISRRLSVKQAMRALVAQAEENDNITTIYVSGDDGRFYGAIDLKDLIIARENTELETLISHSYPYVGAHERIEDCIERLKDYAEDSIPVLNEKQRLIGVITAQDIVEVVDDELGDDYAKLGGLSAEEDLDEPISRSVRKRMPWLIALLFLGMVVSSVAGNVGTQSLAVTIRVLMDEQLTAGQKLGLMAKEMKIGFCNGSLLGAMSFLFVGLYVWLLKGKTIHYAFCVSGCVGVALLVSMVISSFVGTAVPMFFHKIRVDPAVASGPLITTVNDLVAVVTYYGMAWLLLINLLHLVS